MKPYAFHSFIHILQAGKELKLKIVVWAGFIRKRILLRL